MNEPWTVTRHSGRYGAEARVVFEGEEASAREKYRRLADEMRQGRVVLMRGHEVVESARAYRNRTRW